jgi:hypothetical protein
MTLLLYSKLAQGDGAWLLGNGRSPYRNGSIVKVFVNVVSIKGSGVN